jgi:hypothetical protein
MKYYKVFADDLSAPIQGGAPLWDGTLPFQLPVVNLDRSDNECGKLGGWHFVKELHHGLRIAGLWPRHGRPSRAFELACDTEVVERGEKCRGATATIIRELEEKEINEAINVLSNNFYPFAREMAELQIAWREALRRPLHDETKVHEALSECWDGWDPVKMTAQDAQDVQDAQDAQDAWWTAWDAWAAQDAWWTAWDTRDARDACIEHFAVLNDWSKPAGIDRDKLREAYQNGALTVVPMKGNKLGYVMQLAEVEFEI